MLLKTINYFICIIYNIESSIMDYYIRRCPHCNMMVFLAKSEFNCKIYRHGVFKENYKQIDPHLPKEECVRLVRENLVIGCAKPFIVIEQQGNIIVKKCDYI